MSTNGRPRALASSRITATTSSMRSGRLHSSGPQASIWAALARQAQVGVGSMPKRFRSLESSVPGPLAGATNVASSPNLPAIACNSSTVIVGRQFDLAFRDGPFFEQARQVSESLSKLHRLLTRTPGTKSHRR